MSKQFICFEQLLLNLSIKCTEFCLQLAFCADHPPVSTRNMFWIVFRVFFFECFFSNCISLSYSFDQPHCHQINQESKITWISFRTKKNRFHLSWHEQIGVWSLNMFWSVLWICKCQKSIEIQTSCLFETTNVNCFDHLNDLSLIHVRNFSTLQCQSRLSNKELNFSVDGRMLI